MILKNIFFLIFTLLFLSCAGKKAVNSAISDNYSIESGCKTEGECSFTIIKNKSLDIIGSGTEKYYRLTDAQGSMVVKYSYTKKTNPAYADGSYNEEFLFETDENFSNLTTYKGSTAVKRIFGIHCFCRGKAGYYGAEAATIQYRNNTLTFTLPAVAEGQVIDSVKVVYGKL